MIVPFLRCDSDGCGLTVDMDSDHGFKDLGGGAHRCPSCETHQGELATWLNARQEISKTERQKATQSFDKALSDWEKKNPRPAR